MEKTITLQNEDGLHARPAALLVKKASAFKSTIELRFNDKTKNAKSIMSVMSLGVEGGAQITIIAKGDDEAQAIAALVTLIDRKFQE